MTPLSFAALTILLVHCGFAAADEQIKPDPCKDFLIEIESHEPWPGFVPGQPLPAISQKLARHLINRWGFQDPVFGRTLKAGAIGIETLRRGRARFESTDSGFFYRSDGSLNFVQTLDKHDRELLDHSSLDDTPREAFRFKLELDRTRLVLGEVTVSDNRGLIEESQILRQFRDFVAAVDASSPDYKGSAVVLELTHSHPVHALQLYFDFGNVFAPFRDAIEPLALSREDHDFARAWSVKFPMLVIRIVAVLPNGFRYSALYQGGADITARAEDYLLLRLP